MRVMFHPEPFEGSFAESCAIEVYEHGLQAPGVPVYGSLDEALEDWKRDHEQHEAEVAKMAMRTEETPAQRRERLLSWADNAEAFLARHRHAWSEDVIARWEQDIADTRDRAQRSA